jgi:hypothetical protein
VKLEGIFCIIVVGVMLLFGIPLTFSMMSYELDRIILAVFFIDLFIVAPALLVWLDHKLKN